MTYTTPDAEVPGQELVPAPAASPTLFGTDNPDLIIAKASGIARVLKDVIVKQGMALRIGSSEYIKVEGWTTLGSLLGVFPKVEYTRPVLSSSPDVAVAELGWEAAVVVVNAQGVEIGRAEAQCLREENNWKNRDDFALRSMAQTRAMGKALRMPLGWIAVLAGYEATPAEEMPAVVSDDPPFDETGGAQGPEADGKNEAHGDTPEPDAASTTRAEALEARRLELFERLSDLATQLGNRTVTDSAVAKNWTLNAAKPASHLSWLEKQITAAEKAVAKQQQEIPL